MKILENNNKSNSLEENLILVETSLIKEYIIIGLLYRLE